MDNKEKKVNELRVIKTARSLKAINKASKKGLFPLMKKVTPSDEIYTSFTLMQNKITGEVMYYSFCGYGTPSIPNGFEKVLDFEHYYPYKFKSPFAAYLVPRDIEVGERVWLEDLIEDYIGCEHVTSVYRLESCEATWNGEDFDVYYDKRLIPSFEG